MSTNARVPSMSCSSRMVGGTLSWIILKAFHGLTRFSSNCFSGETQGWPCEFIQTPHRRESAKGHSRVTFRSCINIIAPKDLDLLSEWRRQLASQLGCPVKRADLPGPLESLQPCIGFRELSLMRCPWQKREGLCMLATPSCHPGRLESESLR